MPVTLPKKLANLTTLWWEKHVPPAALFALVLCALPFLLFQRNTALLASAAFVLFLMALTRRGRARLLPSVVTAAAVTAFSLLSPYGKVLFRLGGESGFAVTEGALEGGLRRGTVLAGLMFLSQLSVSRSLRLPGRAGAFVAQVFAFLDALTAEDFKMRPGNFVSRLDQRLMEVYESADRP